MNVSAVLMTAFIINIYTLLALVELLFTAQVAYVHFNHFFQTIGLILLYAIGLSCGCVS